MQISAQTHHFSLLTRAICGFECHPVKHYITLVHRGEIEVQILVVSGDCMVHNLFFFFFLSHVRWNLVCVHVWACTADKILACQ